MSSKSDHDAVAANEKETDRRWRVPDVVRREGNFLRESRSLYLKQHAKNPIEWFPWSETALELAVKEGKPIFLSVGYASCHWCHVMEKEVFENDQVAAWMNEHFINIKVDREERPDVDAVYMNALQMMTGGGGWPMSMFLTPSLKPFFGGTYFPKAQFLRIAKQITDAFNQDRQGLDAHAEKIYHQLTRDLKPALTNSDDIQNLEPLLRFATDELVHSFDETWGGTETSMKFPTPERWRWLLLRYQKTGDERLALMMRLTLDKMASGGMFDQLAGGFHRYTVEPTWLIPHFEKMLYDNAQLAVLYLEAVHVLDHASYATVARKTLDFMIDKMSAYGDVRSSKDNHDAANGGFYSSYDADSDGEEGLYYLWSPEEIETVVGKQDALLINDLLGVTSQGNFEGKTILTRRANHDVLSRRHGKTIEEIESVFERWRPQLIAYRDLRVPPALDKKIITSWNGLALSALALGYRVLGEARYRRVAEQLVDFLWATHLRSDKQRLYRASNHGVAEHEAILEDYAFLSEGLLALFQATFDLRYLTYALTLLDRALTLFSHEQAGFYTIANDQHAPLGRDLSVFDHATPSGQGSLVRALITAATITERSHYRDAATKTLQAYATQLRRYGSSVATSLSTIELLLGPYYEVIVAGDPQDERTRTLVDVATKTALTHATVLTVPSAGANAEQLKSLPVVEGKVAIANRPTAYVCQIGSCKQPTSDETQLKKQLMEGWKK